MTAQQQLSEWVLGIYEDEAIGAKVLKSITNVLPDEYVQFSENENSPLIVTLKSIDSSTAVLNWVIDLNEDVEVRMKIVWPASNLDIIVLKYPDNLFSL